VFSNLLERCLKPQDSGSKLWIYWLDVFSGNWSSAQGIVSPIWFAFSAILAILINNALIFIVPAFLYGIIRDWKDRMLLKQAIFSRDEMNKAALMRLFSIQDTEVMERIEQAFLEGEQNWYSYMVSVFGETEASRVREMLDRTVG
jgi:hypothetical protein